MSGDVLRGSCTWNHRRFQLRAFLNPAMRRCAYLRLKHSAFSILPREPLAGYAKILTRRVHRAKYRTEGELAGDRQSSCGSSMCWE